ncbi:hypothetical protein HPB49_010556 [Dermacentor silvarum]|uniref:Uncharacterized protein n=1 Tax=Dermacentor silvarum TaxID=543639 RepID=A0ACB8CWN2_DERSI|nr:hypothetical protein HPB49_010556 [Dermacentor silvarum]
MTRIAETTPQECPLFVEPPMVLPPDNFYGSKEGDEENACFLARSMDCSGEEHYQQEPHRQAGNTEDSMNDLRSIRTLEVDIEIDDVVCRKVKLNQVIHNNGGFTDIDKFTSLRSVLTGDAALETAGLPATASCYSDALEILKERFAKDNLIILNHMQRLIDLQPVRSPNYLRGVRSLYDTVQSQTRALKTLKVSEDNYSSMFYPIFLKSLPHDIVLDFNKTIHCTPEFGGKGRSWKHWRTSTAYPTTEGEH